MDRIILKDEVLTRLYYDETGQIKNHQILLPQHLLQELLESLHGTAHKHPGISKMLQKIRQKYYYPGIAKHVKKWVEGCEICIKDKRVPNPTKTPELLNYQSGTWDPKMRCRSTCYLTYPQAEVMKMSLQQWMCSQGIFLPIH